MKQKDPVLRNETSSIHWNIVLKTPHALAYRLWVKHEGEDWEIIGEGGFADDKVDSGTFEASRGDEFAYWLGIGSDKPQSTFDVSIVLSQDSIILEDGIMQEKSKVNDDGIATRLETVTFQ